MTHLRALLLIFSVEKIGDYLYPLPTLRLFMFLLLKPHPLVFSQFSGNIAIADRTLQLGKLQHPFSILFLNNKTLILCSNEVVITLLGV